MKIAEIPEQAYAHVDCWRREGLRIGLVPTMGALHAGHLSLVERSQQECDITAVTIFVNPTQFGPNEDFARYPRPLEEDLMQLRQIGVDLVFTPTQERLYPPGFSCGIDPPSVAQPLEGIFRPGHLRGVATIVAKLFQILPANLAYFGLKDYQQLAVIRRMTEDLNFPIRVVACPTLREPDGLAMSSRNRYLSPAGRSAALGLWQALQQARQLVADGVRDVTELEKAMEATLYRLGVDRVDYARIVDPSWLTELETIDGQAIALIAAHVGSTRLIDNLLLEE